MTPAPDTLRQTARPYLMATACTGTFAFGTLVAFLGATLPELRTRFGFDIPQSGTLISLLFLPQVPMSFVAGPLIDRFGKKPVLASGSLLCAVALAAISVVHSYQVLAMLVFVVGPGAVASTAEPTRWSPTSTRKIPLPSSTWRMPSSAWEPWGSRCWLH